MLVIDGIDVYYGPVQALRGLSITVGDGEMVALLGANGAGKTTTLRAVSGLLPYKTGSITVGGVEVKTLPPHKVVTAGVAHLAQGRELFADLTVTENLRLGHWSRRRNRGEFDERAGQVFDLFPRLKERAHQAAGTMSGGEQQMLAVGRAMMLRPRLMLLDEPSFGLAPLLVRELFGILGEIRAREGVSMLLVEQNAAMALDLADSAYLIETGRVVISGTTAELKRDDSVRRSYLGY
ncbi:MAG TPA: ABC transporter ATP-binding protein [Frankiaceae bacterium]|nr:ABC transporter ATP-binding protein [Frankiaceae bacterium]